MSNETEIAKLQVEILEAKRRLAALEEAGHEKQRRNWEGMISLAVVIVHALVHIIVSLKR